MKDTGSWRIVCLRYMFRGAQVKAVVIWIEGSASIDINQWTRAQVLKLVLDLVWSGVGEWMRLDSVRYLEGATCSFFPNVWWNDAWKAATLSCSDRSSAMNNQNLSPRANHGWWPVRAMSRWMWNWREIKKIRSAAAERDNGMSSSQLDLALHLPDLNTIIPDHN